MIGFLEQLFGSTAGFMPHGHCYLWTPGLLWAQVLSNALIALAYFVIAGGLAVMVRRIDDMPFGWMYWLFSLFIFTCGVTHVFDVIVIWEPRYWIDAGIRIVTAVASVGTAVLLIPLVPKAVTLIRGARSAMQKGVRLESVVEDLESMYEKTKELEQQKTRFFANVSHELRTPLTLVLGRTRQLLDEGGLGEEQRASVEAVRENARLLLKHVDDLLDIARFEAGRLEMDVGRFDFGQLVRRVTGTFDGLADDCGIDYRVEGPESVEVEMDRTQLESVLMNLLSNAFKFTPDGGTIRVEYAVVEESTAHERHVELAVNDSGPGIPPEEREAIFERFRQVDTPKAERFGGTGLGLVVVRNFVDLHGGEVTVEEAPEGGARFVVTLPTAVATGEAAEDVSESADRGEGDGPSAEVFVERVSDARRGESAAPEPEVEPERAGEERSTVLVVEDNAEMNDFICELLDDEFATVSALDGREALEVVGGRRIDLVITDIMMPEMDGVELIERLRGDGAAAEIPILVLTARADEQLRTDLLRKGVDDFLPKPFSSEELQVRVSNLESVRKTRVVLQRLLESQREDLVELATELAEKTSELEGALEEARLAWNQAERASRAKTEFLGMVSHELRTPLTTLQMQLELCRLQAEAPVEERMELVEQMATPLDRLQDVVEGLLKRASVESGRMEVEPEQVDLGELVGEAVDDLRGRAEDKGLSLTCSDGEAVGPIQTDPKLLRLVVGNLVGNAVKFTEEGDIEVTVEEQEGRHRIRVRDTGPGIKPTDQSQIFQAFARGDAEVTGSKPGVGLGLNLVREAVQALGGRIEVDSKVGEGSVFTVVLPSDGAASTQQVAAGEEEE